MKKSLLALSIAAFAHLGAWAQTYTFTKSTGTYANLVSPTVASVPGWDEDQFPVPIGFSFDIDGTSYTNAVIDANGTLYFVSGQDVKGIFGFGADMMDRGTTTTLSPISYTTTGTAGSRITKIEWKNAGFYDDANSTQTVFVPFPNHFVNYQIWLYEGSNNVEIHMGSSSISAADATTIFGPTAGPPVTIITNATGTSPNFLFDGVSLQGPAANPNMITLTGAQGFPSLTGVGADGTIYTFSTGAATGVAKNLDSPKLSVYPNPVADVVNIEGFTATKGNVNVKVIDALGKEVLNQEMPAAALLKLNVSNLNKGTYFVEVNNGTERIGKSIIKQ